MREHELIEKSKAGDEKAFSILMKENQSKIFKLINNLVHDESLAQDLVQESFLTAFQKLNTFQEKSSFSTWVYRIAYNRAINFLRKKKRIKEEEFQEWISPIHEQSIELHEIQNILQEAMQTLSKKHREVFEMYVFKRMRHKEIAAALNIPEGTVRSRLHYARLKLKKVINIDFL